MVDDIIGVTLAGYNAAQMNSYLNVKSADKYLQFGLDKCKAMVVGKRIESFHAPKLMVDTWETSHGEDGEFIEKFGGKKPMENVQHLTYLGMGISKDGRNMKTIIQRRNKQSGKKRKNYKSTKATWQIYF